MSKKGDQKGSGKKGGNKPKANKAAVGKAQPSALGRSATPGQPHSKATLTPKVAVASSKTTRRAPRPKPQSIKSEWVKRLSVYAQLMRLHKPLGILLLLWPALWSLWLAAGGFPRWDLIVIFTLGVLLMRSAGCVINDYADRKIDGYVTRTRDRPLATGAVSSREALGLFAVLCLLAFGLVLLTNTLTVQLALG